MKPSGEDFLGIDVYKTSDIAHKMQIVRGISPLDTPSHLTTQKQLIDYALEKTGCVNLYELSTNLSYQYEKLVKVYDGDYYFDTRLCDVMSHRLNCAPNWLSKLKQR
jgi:hypothetical protein